MWNVERLDEKKTSLRFQQKWKDSHPMKYNLTNQGACCVSHRTSSPRVRLTGSSQSPLLKNGPSGNQTALCHKKDKWGFENVHIEASRQSEALSSPSSGIMKLQHVYRRFGLVHADSEGSAAWEFSSGIECSVLS